MFRRDPFADVVRRQLELFREQEAVLIRQVEEAEAVYRRAPADEAEASYERLSDLRELGTEALAEIRDAYRRTLDEDTADTYEASFNRAVAKRLKPFALEIRDT